MKFPRIDNYDMTGFTTNYLSLIVYGLPVILGLNMWNVEGGFGYPITLLACGYIWLSGMMCYSAFLGHKEHKPINEIIKLALATPFLAPRAWRLLTD